MIQMNSIFPKFLELIQTLQSEENSKFSDNYIESFFHTIRVDGIHYKVPIDFTVGDLNKYHASHEFQEFKKFSNLLTVFNSKVLVFSIGSHCVSLPDLISNTSICALPLNDFHSLFSSNLIDTRPSIELLNMFFNHQYDVSDSQPLIKLSDQQNIKVNQFFVSCFKMINGMDDGIIYFLNNLISFNIPMIVFDQILTILETFLMSNQIYIRWLMTLDLHFHRLQLLISQCDSIERLSKLINCLAIFYDLESEYFLKSQKFSQENCVFQKLPQDYANWIINSNCDRSFLFLALERVASKILEYNGLDDYLECCDIKEVFDHFELLVSLLMKTPNQLFDSEDVIFLYYRNRYQNIIENDKMITKNGSNYLIKLIFKL